MEEDRNGAKRAAAEGANIAAEGEPAAKKQSVKPARQWGSEFSSKPEQEMWLGGFIPAASALKKVRAVLWENGPQGLETGHVKVVIRRGFRVKTDRGKEWRGYTIVAFTTPEVAAKAIEHYDGLEVTLDGNKFKLKAKRALPQRPRRNARIAKGNSSGDAVGEVVVNTNWNQVTYEGLDPPLEKQLEPLTTEAMRARVDEFAREFPDSDSVKECLVDLKENGKTRERQCLLQCLGKLYLAHPRAYRQIELDRRAPTELCAKLLKLLKELAWPPKRHRKKLVADHYLVVWRDKHLDSYQELRSAAEELLATADEDYTYSHVSQDVSVRAHLKPGGPTASYYEELYGLPAY